MRKETLTDYEIQLLKDYATSASPEYSYALSMYYDSKEKENDIIAIQIAKTERVEFPEIIQIETIKVMVSYEVNGVRFYEDVDGLKTKDNVLENLMVKMADFEEVLIRKLDDQLELEHYTGKINFELLTKAYDLILKIKGE